MCSVSLMNKKKEDVTVLTHCFWGSSGFPFYLCIAVRLRVCQNRHTLLSFSWSSFRNKRHSCKASSELEKIKLRREFGISKFP